MSHGRVDSSWAHSSPAQILPSVCRKEGVECFKEVRADVSESQCMLRVLNKEQLNVIGSGVIPSGCRHFRVPEGFRAGLQALMDPGEQNMSVFLELVPCLVFPQQLKALGSQPR